jgi:hypothetical protein
MIYLVSFDIGEHGAEEFALASMIRAYGDYIRLHGTVWLIRTDQAAEAVARNLKRLAGPLDQLFVCRLQGDLAYLNLFVEVEEWLGGLGPRDFGT